MHMNHLVASRPIAGQRAPPTAATRRTPTPNTPEDVIVHPQPARLLARALAGLIVAASVVVAPAAAWAAPNFKAPFPCGQRWTYSHHSAEVRQALDFVRADGGVTGGTPVVASAAGTAYRFSQPSGAGNYIAVEHGGGWKTYYFHLTSYSVPDGAYVQQGQRIGITGSTGNSSGAHIHYEQLLNGVGQVISINAVEPAVGVPPDWSLVRRGGEPRRDVRPGLRGSQGRAGRWGQDECDDRRHDEGTQVRRAHGGNVYSMNVNVN